MCVGARRRMGRRRNSSASSGGGEEEWGGEGGMDKLMEQLGGRAPGYLSPLPPSPPPLT